MKIITSKSEIVLCSISDMAVGETFIDPEVPDNPFMKIWCAAPKWRYISLGCGEAWSGSIKGERHTRIQWERVVCTVSVENCGEGG